MRVCALLVPLLGKPNFIYFQPDEMRAESLGCPAGFGTLDRKLVCYILLNDPASPRVLIYTATLRCYGHPVSRTPNLDKFAAQGVRFEQAHVAYTVRAQGEVSQRMQRVCQS